MTQIIDFNRARKKKEQKRWDKILSEIEQQIELKEQDEPTTLMEEKGIKNFKNLVKKLRQKHCGEE
jgi:energy-coupling factor transporter ATP-binding protein EcfA2